MGPLLTPVLPVLALVTSLLGAACAGSAEPEALRRTVAGVKVVASGLDHPLGGPAAARRGLLVVTQRERAPSPWSTQRRGEAEPGLPEREGVVQARPACSGLAVDPRFTSNRLVYTCAGWTTATGHDVRVMAWRLDAAHTKATFVRTLQAGLPASTGRHGGCRLLITSNGALVIGTGDAAQGTNPQNLSSLGGKVLRINRVDGTPGRTTRGERRRQPPLRAELRPPQRPGAWPSAPTGRCGRSSTAATATTRSASSACGRNYRWNPVPATTRRPDDRRQPPRHAVMPPGGAPATRPSPRPAPPSSGRVRLG